MSKFFLSVYVWLMLPFMALAQEVAAPAAAPEAPAPAWLDLVLAALKKFVDPAMLAQIAAGAAVLLVFMRGLAELLLWISAKTENTVDNKIAAYVSEATWLLGVLTGKLGFGTPKAVMIEKAKELNGPDKAA